MARARGLAEPPRGALARGFTHVLVNIGALDAPEYETLLAGVPLEAPARERLMSTLDDLLVQERPGVGGHRRGRPQQRPCAARMGPSGPI